MFVVDTEGLDAHVMGRAPCFSLLRWSSSRAESGGAAIPRELEAVGLQLKGQVHAPQPHSGGDGVTLGDLVAQPKLVV